MGFVLVLINLAVTIEVIRDAAVKDIGVCSKSLPSCVERSDQ
jgi:hypothetical protein